MGSVNAVLFKGRKNGISVVIDENADFEDIKSALAEKVDDDKNFFGGAKTTISFQGKPLSEDEEAALLNIIAEKANLSISFVAQDVYSGEPKGGKTAVSDASLYLPEHITKFHGGSLRSGQSIKFAGSVVVLGDINPGAEIIAEGNVIILGAAKGMVHAGCAGNHECFVSAVVLTPTQLRIADIITYIPADLGKKVKRHVSPRYAYVKDGQIYIAPLVNE
ncbi:MAG: septum site-determining protein MinC [Clostridiales bacterium]|jgi:septum site-determining protein MinC|nr:septum site-determining protein MinC [Clostridiales bacterium]